MQWITEQCGRYMKHQKTTNFIACPDYDGGI